MTEFINPIIELSSKVNKMSSDDYNKLDGDSSSADKGTETKSSLFAVNSIKTVNESPDSFVGLQNCPGTKYDPCSKRDSTTHGKASKNCVCKGSWGIYMILICFIMAILLIFIGTSSTTTGKTREIVHKLWFTKTSN